MPGRSMLCPGVVGEPMQNDELGYLPAGDELALLLPPRRVVSSGLL
jgi:hypothetical protein